MELDRRGPHGHGRKNGSRRCRRRRLYAAKEAAFLHSHLWAIKQRRQRRTYITLGLIRPVATPKMRSLTSSATSLLDQPAESCWARLAPLRAIAPATALATLEECPWLSERVAQGGRWEVTTQKLYNFVGRLPEIGSRSE